MESTSPRFKLNQIDWKKWGKGLLIAMCGAGMTYLSEIVLKIDFGVFTPMAVAGWSAAVNFIRKFFTNYAK